MRHFRTIRGSPGRLAPPAAEAIRGSLRTTRPTRTTTERDPPVAATAKKQRRFRAAGTAAFPVNAASSGMEIWQRIRSRLRMDASYRFRSRQARPSKGSALRHWRRRVRDNAPYHFRSRGMHDHAIGSGPAVGHRCAHLYRFNLPLPILSHFRSAIQASSLQGPWIGRLYLNKPTFQFLEVLVYSIPYE